LPGSLIGEMAMLVEHDYGSTIVARDRVFCLKLLRATIHAQMQEDPTLAEHFHDRLTERLLRMADELRRIDQSLVRISPPPQPVPVEFRAATWRDLG
jgi:CRP-like cAMP-binding protein